MLRLISYVLLCLFPLNVWAQATSFETRVQNSIDLATKTTLFVRGKGHTGPTFGAGFILDAKNRLILTNYHVVAQAKEITARTYGSTEEVPCEIVHHQIERDLALLRVQGSVDLPEPLSFTKVEKLKVGQFIIAVGSPGGFDHSASLGIISAINRQLPDQNTTLSFIQTDAPLYHGSSGGPLVNLDGHIIGMNSRGGADGAAGFAIPADDIIQFVNSAKGKKIKRRDQFGYLGVNVQELTDDLKILLSYHGDSGLIINHVFPNGGADQAGLKPNDILLQVNQFQLTADSQNAVMVARNTLAGVGPGKHQVKFWRDGKEITKTVSFQKTPPCDANPGDSSKVSYMAYDKKSCYQTPKGEFIEVNRYWSKKANQPDRLRRGDLIVEISGSIRKARRKSFRNTF